MSAEELPNAASPLSPSGSADTRPEDLTFASVSRDGRRMIFVDGAGHEFSVQIDLADLPDFASPTQPAVPQAEPVQRDASTDTRARAEVSAPARSASPAVTLALRPREIQSRIRSGESPEEVAAAAGTTVDKIMGFAAPVIAEREHMAELAQRASLRRPASEAGSARILGDAIRPLLDAHELGEDALTWDSARRYDGRWNVTADYDIGGRTGRAELVFDAKGKYVTLQNDDARWLVGELVEAEPTPQAGVAPPTEVAPQAEVAPPAETVAAKPRPRDDLFAARQRRMAAAVEPLTEHESDVVEVTLTDSIVAESIVTDSIVTEAVEVESVVETPAEPEAEPVAEEPAKPAKKKRTSVPSWDEIMFGGAR